MKKGINFKYSKYVTKVFETPSTEYSEWFGYYNYDTLSEDQTKMLCGRSVVDGVAPAKGMKIELGYYVIASGNWHHIGESDSWNWQQGAMLQWLKKDNNQERVIYNISKNGRLISRIHNIETGKDTDIDWPIYGITPDGKKSISLDLERSYWCRAYHYQSVANKDKEGQVYDGDGIYEIDLQNNTKKTIITIKDIINTDYRPYFAEKKHWLEHIMINPSGTRFCFLHRFSPVDDLFHYETRLFIANIDGSHLQCIEGWDKVRWSHFGWCGDNAFSIYSYYSSRIKSSSLKKILTKDGFSLTDLFKAIFRKSLTYLPHPLSRLIGSAYSAYQYYELNEKGLFTFVRQIDIRESRIDGHPSFTNDCNYMVTDTYPNKNSWQKLYMYNNISRKSTILAEFYAYYNKKHGSCDLHPKLCRNNDFVVVDSAHDDRHHMILFKINWNVIKENER